MIDEYMIDDDMYIIVFKFLWLRIQAYIGASNEM